MILFCYDDEEEKGVGDPTSTREPAHRVEVCTHLYIMKCLYL